jgi:hypothetical protein
LVIVENAGRLFFVLSEMTRAERAERAESGSEIESERDHGEGQHRPLARETETVMQNYVIREGWWESKRGEVKTIRFLELRASAVLMPANGQAM